MLKALEWIIEHWYLVIALVGFIYGLGRLRGILVTKKELYYKDGRLIYMPAEDLKTKLDKMKNACQGQREECTESLYRKIDMIEQNINAIKTGSQDYQTEMQKTLLKISKHMGKTEEFMDNVKLAVSQGKIGGG